MLISEGFYSITTDKIAKEAGVSIGSLYQFFGNKESVVQAVVKNLLDEDKRLMGDGMRTISSLPPDQRVRAMIQLAFDTCRRNAELRAKLTTIQYYVAEAAYISENIKYFQELVKQNLPPLPGRDMERVSFIMVNAFIGLINTMNINSPYIINDSGTVEEMTRMFYSYLDIESLKSSSSPQKGDFI